MLPEGDEENSTQCGPRASVCVGGLRYALAVVEVKTAVPLRTVEPVLSEVLADPKHRFLTSPEALRVMLKEHIMQAAEQMVITSTYCGLYACTAEVGAIFTLILYCSPAILTILRRSLISIGAIYVQWAYSPSQTLPHFVNPDNELIVATRLRSGRFLITTSVGKKPYDLFAYSRVIYNRSIAVRKEQWM